MNKKSIIAVLLLSCLFIFFTGCGKTGKEEVSLTISAAASLQDSIEEIKAIYAGIQPQVKLIINYAASGTLQQQIEQGAPTDIFISAASKQMDALEKKDLLINETRRNLLENKMVLVVPITAAEITEFAGLTGDGINKLAIGTPDSVPAGKYAQEILQNIGLWDSLPPKLILAKDARQVLTYVESGNCDAGIVYETDAKTSDKVKIAAYAPEKSHSPVLYPIAIIKTSKYAEEARDFLAFLNDDKVKNIFEKYGFTYLKI